MPPPRSAKLQRIPKSHTNKLPILQKLILPNCQNIQNGNLDIWIFGKTQKITPKTHFTATGSNYRQN